MVDRHEPSNSNESTATDVNNDSNRPTTNTKTALNDTKTAVADTKKVATDTKKVAADTKKAAIETKTAVTDTKTAVADTKNAATDTKKAAIDNSPCEDAAKKVRVCCSCVFKVRASFCLVAGISTAGGEFPTDDYITALAATD